MGSHDNMPSELVSDLAGLWYSYGNSRASTKLSSFANLAAHVDGDSYSMTTYAGKTAAFSDNGGLLRRHAGLSYRISKSNSTAYRITPTMHLPLPFVSTFELVKANDPDYLVPASTVHQRPVSPYDMLRIVDANGSYTPKYYQHNLPTIPSTLIVAHGRS
ncbi:Aste57867_16863 [Aphanomyces stellatus]|uniref:Aste57867_16863 protein n=1 Tax=Aphanomyces stellatus TaxID=120398 RepID=A0A485L6J6_9STRA|nr:hypothetical protein As57867_016805 [Aphanomyces stellatus]VFT93627.1 Aste57867_16863 [Aphanomyces stellatus]